MKDQLQADKDASIGDRVGMAVQGGAKVAGAGSSCRRNQHDIVSRTSILILIQAVFMIMLLLFCHATITNQSAVPSISTKLAAAVLLTG